MARNKPPVSAVRRWHRTIGAGAALFVVFMILSGLLINHARTLGLDQRHVSNSFLYGWYGLGEPEDFRSYAVGGDWLSFGGSRLYLNGVSVASVSNGVGAVSNGDMLIAAGGEEILLLDHAGRLIERQQWGPPGAGLVDSLGQLESGEVAVRSSGQLWLADDELLKWRRSGVTHAAPIWSSPASPPDAVLQNIEEQYRGPGLSLERLVLDFHSGRIFGPAGVIIYDLLALAVGFLAISGLVLWLRGRRNGNRNGARPKRRP